MRFFNLSPNGRITRARLFRVCLLGFCFFQILTGPASAFWSWFISPPEMSRPLTSFRQFERVRYPESPLDIMVQEVYGSLREARSEAVVTEALAESSAESYPFRSEEHYVVILEEGQTALLAWIHLIRTARHSILVQNSGLRDDPAGRVVVRELVSAARRGVRVRVLLNRIEGEKDATLGGYLASAHPEVSLRFYNPRVSRLTESAAKENRRLYRAFELTQQRMRNNLLVVDDRMAITGSRSIGAKNFDLDGSRVFLNRDLLVIGPAVHDMTASFMHYWAFALSINATDLKPYADVISSLDNTMFESALDAQIREWTPLSSILDQAITESVIKEKLLFKSLKVRNVKYVYDPPGKNNIMGEKGQGESEKAVLNMFTRARREIISERPYLVYTPAMIDQLRKVRINRRDLEISVLTNSFVTSDNIVAYSAGFRLRKLFLKDLKIRVFETKPFSERKIQAAEISPGEEKSETGDSRADTLKAITRTLHANTWVFDSRYVAVGPFALDAASEHFNTQQMLIVEDETLAGKIEDHINGRIRPAESWTMGVNPDVPVVARISWTVSNTISRIPLVNIWPFRYTTLFDLKDPSLDIEVFTSSRFEENYTPVGMFPMARESVRSIQLKLLDAQARIKFPMP